MRKSILFLCAAAGLLLAACAKVDLGPLEQRVSDLESAVRTIQEARDGGDYITEVRELKSGDQLVGYEISFKYHDAVVVRFGKDGAKGEDGKEGAKGEDGDAFFEDVQVSADAVTFIRTEGDPIVIPFVKTFSLVIGTKDYEGISPSQVINVPYTVTGATDKTVVAVVGNNGYKAEVKKTDNASGEIIVTAPALPGDAQILVTADNGDGNTGIVVLNFKADAIKIALDKKQLAAEGDGQTLTANLNVAAPVTVSAPDWVTVAVEGKEVKVTFAANADEKNARLGKITLKAEINGESSEAVIFIAQAVKGCKIGFDSFDGPDRNPAWKGDFASNEFQFMNNYIAMHGQSNDKGFPIYWSEAKFRRRVNATACNWCIASVDLRTDGAEGGLILFNQNGYDGEQYDWTTPHYRYFVSAGNGSTSGGFYGWNAGGLAAADNAAFSAPTTKWIRLEISNVDRGKTGNHIDVSWGAAYVWTLEEDADGILQPKEIIWSKELWWWNDGGNEPTTTPGYVGVWGRSNQNVRMKNFILSYTDK